MADLSGCDGTRKIKIMNKQSLILKYFDKSSLLTIHNTKYRQQLSSLFQWLIRADGVKNDITTKSLKINKEITAKIICRDNHAVLSGMEELQFLLSEFTKLDFTPLKKDKGILSKNEVVARLKGNASTILSYERTILNILQRMSGISTNTYHVIKLINNTHSSDSMNKCYSSLTPYIAATRKTPWMWLDKKAVAAGGGLTHRLNLSDGILIKDNHLSIIGKAIKTPRRCATCPPKPWRRRKYSPEVEESEGLIEVEVETYNQAVEAIKTFRPNAIMLDNFTPDQAKTTINNLKKEFDLSSIMIEASGGIDENNILEWSKTGVDILSLGSLTHSAKASNFSLEI